MLKVGLTGGIGSGKSTVCSLFSELGATVIDTDQLAREAVEPGTATLAQIEAHFGPGVITQSGSLDRNHLRELVFSNDNMRTQLEGIVHPAIRQLLRQHLKSCTAPYVLIAIPLLIEKRWQDEVDRIAVVDCSEESQLKRAVTRDASTEAQIRRIMVSQVNRETRLEAADDIIHNDSDLESLKEQVKTLHRYYTYLATER